MLNKGLFLACTLALLSACDSSSVDKPAAPQAHWSESPLTLALSRREGGLIGGNFRISAI